MTNFRFQRSINFTSFGNNNFRMLILIYRYTKVEDIAKNLSTSCIIKPAIFAIGKFNFAEDSIGNY